MGTPKTGWRSRAGTLFETEKRPAVAARGMVVTNHPLGSAAGAEMLAAGGNAVDAAVAALFALTVVEPMMVGIFGAGHAHLRRAGGALGVATGDYLRRAGGLCWRADGRPIGVGGGAARPGVRFRTGVDARP